MKTFIVISFSLLLAFPVYAGNKTYGNVTVSKVISTYDGDTLRVNIKGFPGIVGKNIPVRVYGIDTPEMIDKRPAIRTLAKKAKWFAINKVKSGKVITLRNIRRGKYFRIVAEVWIDGKSLGNDLINAGLAKRYYGGKKVKW